MKQWDDDPFQLARGYAPSILCIPRVIFTEDLLQAHISMQATRAIERIMRSRTKKQKENIDTDMIRKCTDILVYYKSSKMNEVNECIRAKVEQTQQHMVICRRNEHGLPMKFSYEDVRLIPQGDLDTQLVMTIDDENTDDDE